MIKKEYDDMKSPILYCCFLFILMLYPFVLAPFFGSKCDLEEIFFFLVSICFLGLSILLGCTAFSMDRKQKAIEYMLTLPISRNQLFWEKLKVRLMITVFLVFGYWYSSNFSKYSPISAFIWIFSAITIAVFLISFSLSTSAENLISLFIISCFAAFLLAISGIFVIALCLSWKTGLIYLSFFEFSKMVKEFEFALYVLPGIASLMVLSIFLSFYFSFKRFDIRSASKFTKRQFKYFLAIFIPSLILSWFICTLGISDNNSLGFGGGQYYGGYLTKAHQMIRERGRLGYLYIYDANSVHWINDSKISWTELLLEDNQYLYFWVRMDNRHGLARLNFNTFNYDILYQIPSKSDEFRWISPFSYDGENFVLLEGDKTEFEEPHLQECYYGRVKTNRLNLIIIDKLTGKIKKMPFTNPLFENYCNPYIFASDKMNGLQFWLIKPFANREKNNILRIWENGKVDNLGWMSRTPCYENHLLFSFSDNSLEIYKLLDSGTELMKKIEGNNIRIPLCNQNEFRDVADILIIKDETIYRLDSNIFNLSKINLNTKLTKLYASHFKYFSPREIYYLEFAHNEKWISIYRIEGNKASPLKQISAIDYGKFDKNGVIISQEEDKWIFYAFPDLQELKFKYLR